MTDMEPWSTANPEKNETGNYIRNSSFICIS